MESPAQRDPAQTVQPVHQAQAPVHHEHHIKPPIEDVNYVSKEQKYSFREDKELGSRRPTIQLNVRVLTVEGIIDIIQKGGKGLELLLETVADVIVKEARLQVDEKEDISQYTFDESKVTWDYIAELPKAERRGGGISKEIWELFAKDYIGVMPSITGFNADKIGNQAKLIIGKFQGCKTNKPILTFLSEQLDVYFANTVNAEEYVECYEFLKTKAVTLLAQDETSLLKNLR